MSKVLRIVAAVAAFGLTIAIGVIAFAQGSSVSSPTRTITVSPTESATSTITVSPTTASPTVAGDGDDFKGPCDEAEHANDPECQGVTLVPEDGVDDDVDDRDDDDDSGPSENSGPGNADDDDEGDDDNSGPSENSGPGNADDDSGSDDG